MGYTVTMEEAGHEFGRQQGAAEKRNAGRGNMISIIIPVLDEGGTINETIAHVRGLHHDGPYEIIVTDGDSCGSTIRMIRDPEVITAISARGRARQMNRGAALASGEILLFLHADTFLPEQGLPKLRAAIENDGYVAGAFSLGIRSDRVIFRITERYAALRTCITKVPFGDQAIFIRRACFDGLGGYSVIPLMEDVELMKRIRRRGDQVRVLADRVSTSARRWEREGILYSTFRNWALQILYALGADPERLAKWYRH